MYGNALFNVFICSKVNLYISKKAGGTIIIQNMHLPNQLSCLMFWLIFFWLFTQYQMLRYYRRKKQQVNAKWFEIKLSDYSERIFHNKYAAGVDLRIYSHTSQRYEYFKSYVMMLLLNNYLA